MQTGFGSEERSSTVLLKSQQPAALGSLDFNSSLPLIMWRRKEDPSNMASFPCLRTSVGRKSVKHFCRAGKNITYHAVKTEFIKTWKQHDGCSASPLLLFSHEVIYFLSLPLICLSFQTIRSMGEGLGVLINMKILSTIRTSHVCSLWALIQ